LRLHIALIILYLLFTCPRATITCIQGVFATRPGRSFAAVTTSDTDLVYTALESLSELTQSIYQASLLPLFASYHGKFRRLLAKTCCCRRRCCCCSGHHLVQIKDSVPPVLSSAASSHSSARKTVKFDMDALEFEIHY